MNSSMLFREPIAFKVEKILERLSNKKSCVLEYLYDVFSFFNFPFCLKQIQVVMKYPNNSLQKHLCFAKLPLFSHCFAILQLTAARTACTFTTPTLPASHAGDRGFEEGS